MASVPGTEDTGLQGWTLEQLKILQMNGTDIRIACSLKICSHKTSQLGNVYLPSIVKGLNGRVWNYVLFQKWEELEAIQMASSAKREVIWVQKLQGTLG